MCGKRLFRFGVKMNKILNSLQIKILRAFFNEPFSQGFFLSGGTALAGFYLFHRESVDLDFFTLDKLDNLFLQKQLESLASQSGLKWQVLNSANGTFYSVLFSSKMEQLKLDFVSDVPVQFGKIENFEGIKVDSLENIAVNKITAVFGRTDAKDFIDLYFLLKDGKFNFYDLVEKAKKKDIGLSEFYLAGMLAGVEKITVFPKMLVPLDKNELQKYFLTLSEDLFRKLKPEK